MSEGYSQLTSILDSPEKRYRSCVDGIFSLWGEESTSLRIWTTHKQVSKNTMATMISKELDVKKTYGDLLFRSTFEKFKTNLLVRIEALVNAPGELLLHDESMIAYYRGYKALMPIPPRIFAMKPFPSTYVNRDDHFVILIQRDAGRTSWPSFRDADVLVTDFIHPDNRAFLKDDGFYYYSESVNLHHFLKLKDRRNSRRNVRKKSIRAKKYGDVRRCNQYINESSQRDSISVLSPLL